ncbi:YxiG-like protein [Streptomyces sp. KR80]|uniref:YxiG-like protein n=1 Tax=Streptomyces sp. KR80 TaxID=3457426 RepID=UPI003FD18B4B
MDVAVLEQMLDETLDQAIVHHGYASYMRDYEVIVYATADPHTGVEPAYLRHLFRYCVEARCETSVSAETWRVSLDDRLIDHETGVDLDGYVWGVKWHCLYPGAKLLPESDATRSWSHEVGIDFHEVLIETNAHRLTLIFSDLQVSEVPIGYAPFVTD